MKFKFALVASLILHFSIFAFILHIPQPKIDGETTYYVDLIHLPPGSSGKDGWGTGGIQGTGNPDAHGEEAGASLIQEPSGSIKDLTVQKEDQSSLRYPDKESRERAEEQKLISVVRKPLATIAKKNKPSGSGPVVNASGILATGISSSGGGREGFGYGSGDGDGFGGAGYAFPYAYYVDMLCNKISASWYNSLVTPGLKGKYNTVVFFRILRNGNIEGLKMEKESGIGTLDLSALRAVENASPFAPLPPDFPSGFLIVHFKFDWEK